MKLPLLLILALLVCFGLTAAKAAEGNDGLVAASESPESPGLAPYEKLSFDVKPHSETAFFDRIELFADETKFAHRRSVVDRFSGTVLIQLFRIDLMILITNPFGDYRVGIYRNLDRDDDAKRWAAKELADRLRETVVEVPGVAEISEPI